MQLFAIDPWKVGPPPDSALGSTHFNMLARAYLVLTDASSECKVHDLKLSAFADLSGPPLYGHILCRMVVQPRSVIYPIAEGILNVKPMVGGRLLRNVRTRLQAGNLICFMNSDIHQCPTAEETLLIVPITSEWFNVTDFVLNKEQENSIYLYSGYESSSKVISTSHTNTILLSTENTSEVEGCDVYIITETEKAMNAWKRAIKQQINDCGIWGEFAFTPTKLTCEKSDPLKETLSRVTGSNLYDKISITGTVSRGIVIGPSPSLSYCPRELSPLRSANSRTAPVKRPKQRANVLELFQPSSNRSEFHKCVIDLDVDDGYGKIKSGQAPLNSPPLTQTFHGGMIQHCSSLSRQAQVENFYSPHTNGARTSVSAHNYSTEKSDDKKSWSRSFGALIDTAKDECFQMLLSDKLKSTNSPFQKKS
uniref:PH domain-containing protein n=1 Tax=Heterorhabditis bacteriophora TaxID=37862 RepID=A0A1I7WXT8_HETBA